jgi:serine/threonine protein kinase
MENQPKNSTTSQVASVVNLPGYKIIDVLGKGGMAVVYLAIQESIGRQVALKILAPDHTDETFTDRFLREARIISNLTHPNIITVYDANVHQGCHYMSMEYVPGNSLRESRDKLTRKQKVDVIKQVGKALDYAGKKGYVHRDIKPENILLHEDGRAILTDFGIARSQNATKGLTITGKVVGTPYYMSPEQTKGVKVDHRSDIYSLGIVLFQALAGHLPYDGPSFVAIGIKHLSDPIPELPKGLEIFQPIINICMSKDPAHRYQTANELVDALEKIDDADLDFIETRATAAKKSSTSYNQKTLASDAMPPVVSARPKKQRIRYSNTDSSIESAVEEMDVTSSDDFRRLNRRKRWILLFLLAGLAAIGYHKKDELLVFYQTELAPTVDAFIDKYNNPSSEPVNQGRTDAKSKPATETAVPNTPDNHTSAENNPGTSNNIFSVGESETSTTTVLREQLATHTPDSIEQLTQSYRQRLQSEPNDETAVAALKEIANWYVLQTNSAIENNSMDKARQLIAQANSSLPRAFYPPQLVALEDRLMRREAIQSHLQQAKQYIDEGSLVVPAGHNAVDSLNAALAINPEHTEARQLLNEVITHYYGKASSELGAGNYRAALTSVELGLTVNANDQRLIHLKETIQNEIRVQEKIAALLKVGETRLQAGNAVEPGGESAIAAYNEVLAVQADNQAAKAGIKAVEEYVVKQIQTAIWENKLSIGQRILNAAFLYFPNSAKLDQAAAKLKTAMNDRAPRITHLIVSDHVISSLLTEQATIKVTPTLYLGFTYTNFSKETTILNLQIVSVNERRVLLNKKLFVSESTGEHIFSVKHPQATFIRGQYKVIIKLNTRVLLDQPFTVETQSKVSP